MPFTAVMLAMIWSTTSGRRASEKLGMHSIKGLGMRAPFGGLPQLYRTSLLERATMRKEAAMCGRFTLTLDPGDLQDVLNFDISSVDLIAALQHRPLPAGGGRARWHLAQGGAVPVGVGALVGQGCQHRLQDDQCPFRDDQREALLPGAVLRRRCLIPADGFYEWAQGESGKIPYYFYLKDHQALHLCRVVGGMAAEGGRAAAYLHDHHLRGE